MDPLNLSIPRQHDYIDPTVEQNPVRLQDWLTNLPLMDVLETVRRVLGALEALNEQKLEADEQRFQLLEVYRATGQRLFVTLDPLNLRQLALTKAQRQEAIDGVARLFLGIGEGYKLIVSSLYRSSGSGQPPSLLGNAINRALEQLSYALLDSYRFYRPLEPVVMAEAHQLYRLARHYGFLNTGIEEADTAHPMISTAVLYHTAMLLSLTDPYRLAEGEVGLLFDILVQHADGCRIIPGNSWSGSGEGLFLIDLRTAEPPVPCTRLTPPVDAREPYLLDATATLAAIRERLAQTPARVRLQSPEAMVLRRLLPEVSGTEKRREPRHADGRQARLLPGLENIHSWLLHVARETPATTHPPEPSPCKVLDASNSGMKLAWQGGGAGDARVGDLLGILEAEGRQQSLRLVLIRSIRVYREGGMEVGVQLMHGGLGAVTCCVPDEPDRERARALFMSASEAEQCAATLITAKGLYTEGRRLLVDVDGREIRVRAGCRVFDSPVIDRFEFAAE